LPGEAHQWDMAAGHSFTYLNVATEKPRQNRSLGVWRGFFVVKPARVETAVNSAIEAWFRPKKKGRPKPLLSVEPRALLHRQTERARVVDARPP
jgi:hypothetical protein